MIIKQLSTYMCLKRKTVEPGEYRGDGDQLETLCTVQYKCYLQISMATELILWPRPILTPPSTFPNRFNTHILSHVH